MRFCVTAFMIVVLPHSAYAADLDAARKAWADYQSAWQCVKVDCLNEATITSGDKPSRQTNQIVVGQLGSNVVVQMDEQSKNGVVTRLDAVNDQYFFSLSKLADADWILSRHGEHSDPLVQKRLQRTVSIAKNINSPLSIEGMFLPDVIDSFRIVEDKPDIMALESVGEVVFSRSNNKVVYSRITLELDMRNGYFIRSVVANRLMNATKGSYEQTSESVGTAPMLREFLSHSIERFLNPSGLFVIDMHSTLKYEYAPDYTPESFRLSAYGFPEPAGVAWERPTPRSVWFGAAAAVLAVISFVLWKLKGRSAAKQSSVT